MLRVPPEGLDVRRFEARLEQGRRELASGEAERASLTLRDALALWRGPALADLALEPFAQTEIARLEELRLTALEARIEADLALGRQDSLVAELETLVAVHPYREGLRAQLMLALYRSGRQAEALETYRRARRAFSEELGIEPSSRLQELERAILRHDSSLEPPLQPTLGAREEESSEKVRRRRFPTRSTLALAIALILVVAAALLALVAAARDSSGGSHVPVELMGDSVAVIDPGTDTIVGEIPVGGRPTGPAVGEGSVWVGNRDDNTLLRIDPRSLDVHTIGLGVAPTDVEVIAGSVWILSDRALLRVDPGINDVVDTIPLPRGGGSGRWSHMEVGAKTVFVCNCHGGPGSVIRIDPATTSVESVRRSAVADIAYGEGALWALTGGARHDRTDRPKDERSHRDHSARTNRRDQWLALSHGNSAKVRSGCWLLRHCGGSIPRPSASWEAFRWSTARKAARPDRRRSCLGRDLRGGPCFMSTRTPRRWPSRFRSGLSSTPPTVGTRSRLVRDRSGLRSRRSLRDDLLPAAPRRGRPNRAARLLACSEVLFEKSGKHLHEMGSEPEGRDARHDPRAA